MYIYVYVSIYIYLYIYISQIGTLSLPLGPLNCEIFSVRACTLTQFHGLVKSQVNSVSRSFTFSLFVFFPYQPVPFCF